MKHLKVGKKSNAIAASMVTTTFKYGGYSCFKLM